MFKNNKRWAVGFLMFLGIVINYMDRVNISHAILQIKEEFHLTPTQQGIILSSFSWGYVLFMIFGGILADKKSSRFVAGFSCLAWSMFTGLGGLATNFQTFLATRFLLGAGEAPIFPANAKIVKTWFPKNERGLATALFDSGSYVGSALVAPFIIWLMLSFGWRVSFLIFSIMGVVWSLVWFRFYKEPQNTNLSEQESKLLQDNLKAEQEDTQNITAWQILKNRKVLSASFGFFCYNYLKNFFLTWFPTYLVTERGFSIIKVGFIAILPPLMAIFGELLTGYFTDKMITKGVNINIARKLPLCVGLLVSSCIVLSVFTDNVWIAVGLLTLSYTGLISASTGIWAIPGDLTKSKRGVALIGGVQNTFSNIAGIIAPILTGFLLETTKSFVLPIAISGVLTILGAISYWFFMGNLEEIKFEEKNV